METFGQTLLIAVNEQAVLEFISRGCQGLLAANADQCQSGGRNFQYRDADYALLGQIEFDPGGAPSLRKDVEPEIRLGRGIACECQVNGPFDI